MADEALRVTRFINGKPDRTTAKHVYAKDLTKADQGSHFFCCGTGINGECCPASLTLVCEAKGRRNYFAALDKKLPHAYGCNFDESAENVILKKVDATGNGVNLDELLDKFSHDTEKKPSGPNVPGEDGEPNSPGPDQEDRGTKTIKVEKRPPSNVKELYNIFSKGQEIAPNYTYAGIEIDRLLINEANATKHNKCEVELNEASAIVVCAKTGRYANMNAEKKKNELVLMCAPEEGPYDDASCLWFFFEVSEKAENILFDKKNHQFAIFSSWERSPKHKNVFHSRRCVKEKNIYVIE